MIRRRGSKYVLVSKHDPKRVLAHGRKADVLHVEHAIQLAKQGKLHTGGK